MKKIYYKNVEAYSPEGGIEIIPIPTQTGADKEASEFFNNHYPGYELISIMEHHVFTIDEPDPITIPDPNTMYEKACYVLKQMIDWINETLGEYSRNEDFPQVNVFGIERIRIDDIRGYCNLGLYIGGCYGVFVGGLCDDGYFYKYIISEKTNASAYNGNNFSTINLASLMASRWVHIKRVVTKTVEDYKKKQINSNEILSNFKI